jgi:hypothetical protein
LLEFCGLLRETQRVSLQVSQSPGDRGDVSTKRSVRKFRRCKLHSHYYVCSAHNPPTAHFCKAETMKAYSRSPVWTALFVVAASSFVAECEARTWIDVVNPSVFVAANLDVYRMEFFLEDDPLAFPSSAPTWEPTGSSDSKENTVDDGGASSSPSASPTARYDNVEGYGGCPVGEYLYELEMLDSWGDGWDDSVIKIMQMAMEENPEDNLSEFSSGEGTIFTPAVNIFEGGLATGREGFSYLCLEPFKCYTVDIDGGFWGEEIKWEIRAVPLGYSREERENMAGLPVAKGLAPISCQFSIPDEVTGEMECPFICDNASASSSVAPSTGPAFISAVATASQSSSVPSPKDSVMPSDAPSFVPSSIPSAIQESANPNDGAVTASESPTTLPSAPPSARPSAYPSGHPSAHPSDTPSTFPSASPSAGWSRIGNVHPSSAHPTDYPSDTPSTFPSASPSARWSRIGNVDPPTDHPTDHPAQNSVLRPSGRTIVLPLRPTLQPSLLPSDQPSLVPTDAPWT